MSTIYSKFFSNAHHKISCRFMSKHEQTGNGTLVVAPTQGFVRT
jgi:hypothetical protein